MPVPPDPNLARAKARFAYLRGKLTDRVQLDALDMMEAISFEQGDHYDAICGLLDGTQELCERQLGVAGLVEMTKAEESGS